MSSNLNWQPGAKFQSPWATVCWVLAVVSILGGLASEQPLAFFAPWCFAVLALLIDIRGQLQLMTARGTPPLPPELELPKKRERFELK